MADMEKIYDDLKFINLYFSLVRKRQKDARCVLFVSLISKEETKKMWDIII